MVVAATSTPREARWLHGRLKTLSPPLPLYRDTGRSTARHIVYTRQGGADVHVTGGTTYTVRSAWLAYVSQPVTSSSMVYAEDLQADADRMHEALVDPAGEALVDGRYVAVGRRDIEHSLPVYDGTTLVEYQLGGIYIVLSSLT